MLLLTRGAPGAGKSTFIEQKGLVPFTLSPDTLRLLHHSPQLTEQGRRAISHKSEKTIWSTLLTLLEQRMRQGDLTVIDATHTRAQDFTKYKELALRYRYRVVCIDFSEIPKEILFIHNLQRPDFKIVPEEVIDKFHHRANASPIPSWVSTVKPEDFDSFFHYLPRDLSNYRKVHHIGDVHGCLTPLAEFLEEGIQDDEFYIFVGDYVDRGIQNAETLSYLFSLMNRKNVVFLEGNHEIHLWNWANGRTAASKEFEKNTRLELERNGVSKKTARSFYRTLHQCFLYNYGDKRVLVTHGGLPYIPDNLLTVPTEQLIKGVGDYNTEIDLYFTDQALTSDYQIHGHRNNQRHPTQVTERTFNLEGQIEKGGHLRTVSLTPDGFCVLEVKNTIFNDRFIEREMSVDANNHDLLQLLRSNKLINERKQLEANISSFNFKREVFHDALWTSQTMKARGLFFNTDTAEIVARSYDKFFNIGEMRSTELVSLQKSLMFPVHAYVKPNGFLGITGVDGQSDQLIIASKSTTAGPYKEWFETILTNTVPLNTIERMKEFMKRTNTSFVFEVIDPVNDPHMVEYEQPHIVLLDIIYRTPKFERLPYEELQATGQEFSITVKERTASFNNWPEFSNWHESVTTDWSLEIEGFVLEDSDSFMTKIKLPYYSFWKWMRTIKDRIARGQSPSAEALADPIAKRFIDWLESYEDKDRLLDTDIITLRKAFEEMPVPQSNE